METGKYFECMYRRTPDLAQVVRVWRPTSEDQGGLEEMQFKLRAGKCAELTKCLEGKEPQVGEVREDTSCLALVCQQRTKTVAGRIGLWDASSQLTAAYDFA